MSPEAKPLVICDGADRAVRICCPASRFTVRTTGTPGRAWIRIRLEVSEARETRLICNLNGRIILGQAEAGLG